MSPWTVHHGDALTILPHPARRERRSRADRPAIQLRRPYPIRPDQGHRPRQYVSGDAAHQLRNFVGDNRDQRSYTAWLSLVLAGCFRSQGPAHPCSCSPTGGNYRPPATPCRPAAGYGAASSADTNPSPARVSAGSKPTVSTYCGARTGRSTPPAASSTCPASTRPASPAVRAGSTSPRSPSACLPTWSGMPARRHDTRSVHRLRFHRRRRR